jgi:hypothetical protein
MKARVNSCITAVGDERQASAGQSAKPSKVPFPPFICGLANELQLRAG